MWVDNSSCSYFFWNHDVWEDQGGGHVHSLLVFRFVSFSLLVFLQIERKIRQTNEDD